MKKLISILGTISLLTSAGATVISCNSGTEESTEDLNSVILVNELGKITINNSTVLPTKSEILSAIKVTNSNAENLTMDDFDFVNNPSTTSATITGKVHYTGEITLNYNCIFDINCLVTEIDLGQITSNNNIPTKTQLLTAMQNKNPKTSKLTINDFDFKNDPSSTEATISGKGIYTGEISLYYNCLIDIKALITITDLAQITSDISIPTKTQLLTAIQNKNPLTNKLTINDFDFKNDPSSTEATISGKGSFTGEITLNYNCLIDISKIITITNLDEIISDNNIPTKTQLLTAIQNKNPLTNNLTINDFDFKNDPSSTEATISGKGSFTGEITLNYNCIVDLNSIIPTTNLQTFTASSNIISKDDILKAIQDNNPQASILTINDFDFKNDPSFTTATITGKGQYGGEITLTYSAMFDLNAITQLTGLNLVSDQFKHYYDAWSDIFNANELKGIRYNRIKISFFKTNDPKDTYEITSISQTSGAVYVVIQVPSGQEINCFGKTIRLQVVFA